MAAIKNATQWYPPSGKGFVKTQGTLFLTNNSANFIVDNSGNFLVTTATYIIPKNPVFWTATGA